MCSTKKPSRSAEPTSRCSGRFLRHRSATPTNATHGALGVSDALDRGALCAELEAPSGTGCDIMIGAQSPTGSARPQVLIAAAVQPPVARLSG